MSAKKLTNFNLNLIVRKTPRLLEGLVLIELALFLCWWSHLGSNQGPTDYESVIFDVFLSDKPL